MKIYIKIPLIIISVIFSLFIINTYFGSGDVLYPFDCRVLADASMHGYEFCESSFTGCPLIGIPAYPQASLCEFKISNNLSECKDLYQEYVEIKGDDITHSFASYSFERCDLPETDKCEQLYQMVKSTNKDDNNSVMPYEKYKNEICKLDL